MKKIYFSLFVLMTLGAFAQITVTTAMVPQYIQGNSGTNNNRTPFWFWAELSGLTPGATYRFYSAVDSIGAAPTSNGAGNPYLINQVSKTFRRSTNASLIAVAGHDSLTADNTGGAKGWFGVEPSGNGRFTPGKIVFPKLVLNNGAGGTAVANRVDLSTYTVTVLNFGTTSGNALQGSALYDSAIVSLVAPKSFAALYDNNVYTGRPLSLAVVEDDAMYLRSIAAIANFYQNQVDSIPQRWGTIIPNANPNGVQGLQYFDFSTAMPINPPQYTDNDGNWCSGALTVSPNNGTTGLYLNSNFSLTGTAGGPDTLTTGSLGTFTVGTNGVSPAYTWDFGDGSATSANPTHTYTATGTYTVTVIIQTPYCGIVATHTVEVIAGTSGIKNTTPFNMSISPNPSNGVFMVNSFPGEKKVSVLNSLGAVVHEFSTNDLSFVVNISTLPKGMYWLRVTHLNGCGAIQKILVK